jgi:aminoglycoside/choline kinase family phosphotransferase/dTDP-glucose pyrophosphorylase
MKAMILAAGFGTRLQPHTNFMPKPLFTIAGQSVLDMLIESLIVAGCESIVINTHHLAGRITGFLQSRIYSVPIFISNETKILGTGGAIKKAAHLLGDHPFLLINGDIVTNINFKSVYEFHLGHDYPVTLVLLNDPQLNSVSCDDRGFVKDFQIAEKQKQDIGSQDRYYTFTGIQVLDPGISQWIPSERFYNSIDAYRRLLASGESIKAFFPKNTYWIDIGTESRYKQACIDQMVPEVFRQVYGKIPPASIQWHQLAGDGSDRKWYRLSSGAFSVILADHGIHGQRETSEARAFISIGKHLYQQGIPVPEIYLHDTLSGLVFLEDLGNVNLQQQFFNDNQTNVTKLYETVVDQLCEMFVKGARGFNPSWTYQTPRYNKQLILEHECRYFVDAFLNDYLGLDVKWEQLEDDFLKLSNNTLKYSINGFMHRDFQSRNIMVKDGRVFFIDFQGGRMGPIQYDLASLIIDPYVRLPFVLREHLKNYCRNKLSSIISLNNEMFEKGFQFCSITRNLQILGAFGFLSGKKKKLFFRAYIPPALHMLSNNLSNFFGNKQFEPLKKVVEKVVGLFTTKKINSG